MEAEYVALSQSCKDLFPLLDLVHELGIAPLVSLSTNIPISTSRSTKTMLELSHLVVYRLEPRRMTPRSKHYAIKYHWFREQIGPRNIKLVKINTTEQLGDIFTKGLTPGPFNHLRRLLMGW